MTARQFAKHRETFCLASAGSDEEFHAYLSGFDAAVAIADLAAPPAQAQGAKPLHLSDDLRGQLWQIVLKMTACDDDGCGQNNCSCMARYARILAAIDPAAIREAALREAADELRGLGYNTAVRTILALIGEKK